jgi:uncharacterized protein (DUF2062 family)
VEIKMMEKLKARLHAILTLNVPPKRLALACALGVWIGFSPYIGLHTILAFTFSYLFRMPIYPLLMGAHLSNPITIPIIYPIATELGMYILNVHANFDFDWKNISVKTLWEKEKPILFSFWLGLHIMGAALSVFTYFVSYHIIKRYRRAEHG